MKKCVFTIEREIPTWEEVYNSLCIDTEDDWDEGSLCFRVRDVLMEDCPTMIKEDNKIIFKYYENTAILTEQQWYNYMLGDISNATLIFKSSYGNTTYCRIKGIRLSNGETSRFWENPFYDL